MRVKITFDSHFFFEAFGSGPRSSCKFVLIKLIANNEPFLWGQ
jgi:hypothetical protein